jgi:hypothetical protein
LESRVNFNSPQLIDAAKASFPILLIFRVPAGNNVFPRPLIPPTRRTIMNPDQRKHAYKTKMLLAGALVAAGLAMSGLSLARLNAEGMQLAQATQPLQSTPGAETKPSAPAEPATTGTRPNEVAPQPARPDTEAQKAGATPALPAAPAEKMAPPIKDK